MTAEAQKLSYAESKPCVVLYVEDDDATAYLFQKALDEAGARLLLYRATDGDAGLAFLRRDGLYRDAPTPHLIILDIDLPEKSGFDVLTAAQQIETLKNVPKVMFSASSLPEYRERALALGADKFFSKNGWDAFVETAKEVCSMLQQEPR